MSNIGVNFKYGITSSITLDAAINPDFGQVESDKSIINLTTYETYFEEKRPFFLEGSEIFRTPFIHQFYTRRIGRKPGQIENAIILDEPQNTTILSALKLTGKTHGGTAFGVLNVMTQKEKTKYRIDGDPEIHEAVVEPAANYSVARIRQDIFENSYVGGMITFANQIDRNDALTASGDWRLNLSNQKYSISGIVIGTHNGPGTTDLGANLSLSKNSGKILRGNISAYYFGDRVNWNRMGYMERNSYRGGSGWIQLYSNEKFYIFKQPQLNFNSWYNENLDGFRSRNGGNINGSVRLINNWSLWSGVGYDGSRYDDRQTRGNGLWFVESNFRYWMGMHTNPAGKIMLELNYHHDNERDGLFYLYGVWTTFRPISNFTFSLGFEYNLNRKVDFWVGTGEDGLPVFGDLDNDDLDISFRGTYTFTRKLTLQCFTQLYFSTGKYDNFRKLSAVDRLETVEDDYKIKISQSDFNYKALNFNLILRWEYLPGSALYAVWTQAREGIRTDYGNFQLSRDFDELFRTPQTNTFLIKVDYWWNI
jgi:hypothetical protein